MGKFKIKMLSVLLSVALLTGSVASVKALVFNWSCMVPNAVGAVLVNSVPKIVDSIWYYIVSLYEDYISDKKVKEYGGFQDSQEIIKNLEKIVNDEFEICVYDQKKAKSQMFDALSSVVARVDILKRGEKDVKEIHGNIIYLIGPSGTGKTKMTYAIANAFLKHPGKTCIFCHSESITNEAELGTQLFKTVASKDIGKRRVKNIFGNDGLFPKDEESPILKHILKWHEAVVIIDEYEKMKEKSAQPGTTMNILGMGNIQTTGTVAGSGSDKSADEILRSIASTGKYKFMNKEVDCSKILFLVTTNETREELEKNFGIRGVQGGGIQRLNVVEFDHLSLEACSGIVKNMIDDITKVLTDKNGPFKLRSINFDDESCGLMIKYMFKDKVLQGRVKNKLEDKIYSLFSKDIGKDNGKEFKVSFKPYSEDYPEHFIKEVAQ